MKNQLPNLTTEHLFQPRLLSELQNNHKHETICVNIVHSFNKNIQGATSTNKYTKTTCIRKTVSQNSEVILIFITSTILSSEGALYYAPTDFFIHLVHKKRQTFDEITHQESP